MILRRRPAIRAGFTLLEIILASAIALVLLAALYETVSSSFRQTQEGRDKIQQVTLQRAVMARIRADVLGAIVAPIPPQQSSDPDQAAAIVNLSNSTRVPFTAGLLGDNKNLIVYVSKASSPSNLAIDMGGSESSQTFPSDIRRITYALDGEKGLIRREDRYVTGSDIDSGATDASSENTKVLAEEVTDLEFEYWDGQSWLQSWDGSITASDGLTPIGPPAAIRVTLFIRFASSGFSNDAAEPKKFTQTVTLECAPGIAINPLLAPPPEPMAAEGTEAAVP